MMSEFFNKYYFFSILFYQELWFIFPILRFYFLFSFDFCVYFLFGHVCCLYFLSFLRFFSNFNWSQWQCSYFGFVWADDDTEETDEWWSGLVQSFPRAGVTSYPFWQQIQRRSFFFGGEGFSWLLVLVFLMGSFRSSSPTCPPPPQWEGRQVPPNPLCNFYILFFSVCPAVRLRKWSKSDGNLPRHK